VDLFGEDRHGIGVHGDPQRDPVVGPVIADLEVERVVQVALVGLGQHGRVDGYAGQPVEERGVVASRPAAVPVAALAFALAVVLAECGQPLGHGAVLGGQLGEPALQRRTHWLSMSSSPVGW
jgi:hypothetical protein